MVKVIFTRPRFQCWSEPSGRLPDAFGGHQTAQTQRILCCVNISDHSGLIWDHFGTYSQYPNFYYFPDIMLGSPSLLPLCSAIFEVRTLIIGQNDLCPYVDSGFECQEYLKTLHFDRFFMDHPLSFPRYNDGISVAPKALLAHFWSEDVHIWHGTSLSICGLGVWLPSWSEEVAFWPIFHGPPP